MRKLLTLSSRFVLVIALGLVASSAAGQPIYPTTPDWVSGDTQVSTGAALVDLDRDGWLDLVVANGNDIFEQPLAVYYNDGSGGYPSFPDWQSTDLAFNGHLDVADVNGDGWPDVAVAILGEFNTVDHAAKLYLNNGGTLSSVPDWQSEEYANAFGCAFGDVNNDGRPDLAVATGWAYSPPHNFSNYLYINNGGTLASSASWSSDDDDHLQGVLWVDANRDGWLDLVGVAAVEETRVYTNLGGNLETTASWETTDSAGQDAIMGVAGDVDGDDVPDLIVTDNTQLGGTGRFRQYDGLLTGYFETSYSWSYYEGYGSAVALADVDGDGDLDLATGGWWDHTRLFLNDGTGLPTTPDWSSTPTSVIEKIVFGDINRDGVYPASETFPANGGRLFQLSHRLIQEVLELRLDGLVLSASEYVLNREAGWVTVSTAPASELQVDYSWSRAPDMAVTNWDSSVGNFVYYSTLGPLFADGFESGDTSGWSTAVPVAAVEREIGRPAAERGEE
jgi:hypothetical protein